VGADCARPTGAQSVARTHDLTDCKLGRISKILYEKGESEPLSPWQVGKVVP